MLNLVNMASSSPSENRPNIIDDIIRGNNRNSTESFNDFLSNISRNTTRGSTNVRENASKDIRQEAKDFVRELSSFVTKDEAEKLVDMGILDRETLDGVKELLAQVKEMLLKDGFDFDDWLDGLDISALLDLLQISDIKDLIMENKLANIDQSSMELLKEIMRMDEGASRKALLEQLARELQLTQQQSDQLADLISDKKGAKPEDISKLLGMLSDHDKLFDDKVLEEQLKKLVEEHRALQKMFTELDIEAQADKKRAIMELLLSRLMGKNEGDNNQVLSDVKNKHELMKMLHNKPEKVLDKLEEMIQNQKEKGHSSRNFAGKLQQLFDHSDFNSYQLTQAFKGQWNAEDTFGLNNGLQLSTLDVTQLVQGDNQESIPKFSLDKQLDLINHLKDLMVKNIEVGQKNNEQTLQIQLKPEYLGQLRMQFSLQDGELRGHIWAQNQQVKELIQTNLVELRNQLGEQGLNFSELDVSVEQQDKGNEFLFQNQGFNQTPRSMVFEEEEQDILPPMEGVAISYDNNEHNMYAVGSLDLRV